MTITTTVDHYADRITKIADEMKAAGISTEYNTGAVAILRDIASDLRCQVRHRHILPSRVNFDSISAFGGRQIQASASSQRTDLPANITAIFAAARMAPPAAGTTLTIHEVDALLREAGVVEPVERMSMKNQLESAGVANFGDGNRRLGIARL